MGILCLSEINNISLLSKQIENIDKILSLNPCENSGLESRLFELKAEIERYKELIERPLNIGVIGNSNSGKTELVNKLLSLNSGLTLPANNINAEICCIFSENQSAIETYITDSDNNKQFVDSSILSSPDNETLKSAKRIDIKFPATNELAKVLGKKNVSVTLYPDSNGFEQLKKLDLAIIAIKASEYANYSQLLNYIVDNEKITIPIVIVFTSMDGVDDVVALYQAYQRFENQFFITNDSQNEISKLARLVKHFVNPDKNAIVTNNDAIIEQHRLKLVNEKRNVLKTLLLNLKNEVEKTQSDDGGFQIAKIANKSEAQNLKKFLLLNLENQHSKYITEIDSMISEVNKTKQISQIDRIEKALKNTSNYEHHIDNADNYYSDYKDKLKEVFVSEIRKKIGNDEQREQLVNATESAFITSLDLNFDKVYKLLKVSTTSTLYKKFIHHLKTAIKNIFSLVSNPNILIGVLVGIGLIFGLILLMGAANTPPFSWILTDDMQISITKVVVFLVAVLALLVCLAIWVVIRKNKKIAFNNYKTQTINELNSKKTPFPRSVIDEKIDRNNKRVIAEINEVAQLFVSERRQEEKQKEQIIELAIEIIDNL